jgi:hypothetical protein
MSNVFGDTSSKAIPAVEGFCDVTEGVAVKGNCKAAGGFGVWGRSDGGQGVRGESKTSRGVVGISEGFHGVFGKSTSNVGVAGESDTMWGVLGVCKSPGGVGVVGQNAGGIAVSGASDSGQGVRGESKTSRGVVGISQGFHGVYGKSTSNVGVAGESDTMWGVLGVCNSPGGVGVVGQNTGGDGVVGRGRRGVVGESDGFQGVYGHSRANAGVVGESVEFDGVWGISRNPKSAGVSGHNSAGGVAGRFEGDLVVTGVIHMTRADYAEDFFTADPAAALPGMVMVLDDAGGVCVSEAPYDRRVAGIVSGAGRFKPAVILDHDATQPDRVTLALMGKACCLVDATAAPVATGDLLTTSSVPGHAMKALDPARAFGAVIGKALEPLAGGRGLVSVLVRLQ